MVVEAPVTVIIECPPDVWFLDTPQARAITEHFAQRSVYTLRRYERLGLKVHTLPGNSDDPEKKKHGERHFILRREYLEFLKTFSE